jgi:hypothetical protein
MHRLTPLTVSGATAETLDAESLAQIRKPRVDIVVKCLRSSADDSDCIRSG